MKTVYQGKANQTGDLTASRWFKSMPLKRDEKKVIIKEKVSFCLFHTGSDNSAASKQRELQKGDAILCCTDSSL